MKKKKKKSKNKKSIVHKIKETEEFIKTGIKGFDELIPSGIPKVNSVMIAGGPGTGKTIWCLQTMYNAAKNGEKALYISFEESENRLRSHMRSFGWNIDELEKKGLVKIIRIDPFAVSRAVEAMLAKVKGELLINIGTIPQLVPKGFKPDRIFLDSLSALAAAFVGGESGYRVYIERLFRYFEQMKASVFLISEVEQDGKRYSRSGVEEFLADGVVVLYNFKRGNYRVRALEILKMRGTKHEQKIVPFSITNRGIMVYPGEPVFTD